MASVFQKQFHIQMNRLVCVTALMSIILACASEEKKEVLNDQVHIFYYNWYGNQENDGEYHHWNHDILPHWSDSTWDNKGAFPGKEDIGANFYPALGCYSSNDSSTITKHMEMMVKAGVGAFAISWWGKDSYEERSIPIYLDIADKHGLKLIFHIEPFYTNAEELKVEIDYLSSKYGRHPALFLLNEKPFYYIYDSYKLDIEEWQKLLTIDGEFSVRNSIIDATFIGLWVNENEGDFFTHSGFDGFYTYFASDGFVYGSTSSNWKDLAVFAKQRNLIFVPCAGPGYIDTRIRPWNSANSKERRKGKYFEEMFESAVKVAPDFIGITSFNEWHEGTQIEPAVPKSIPSYTYEDYGEGVSPMFYILKTKKMVSKLRTDSLMH